LTRYRNLLNKGVISSPDLHFPESRQAALSRLDNFLENVERYKRDRNFVRAGHSSVSRLSPAIRSGLLHPSEVISRTVEKRSRELAEKFVQECMWRVYWKGWLEWRPVVWKSYREEVASNHSSLSGRGTELFEDFMRGQSEVPLMNRFRRELSETGYLHNHARMWFAGYWVHTLRLPWALGADCFYRELLDADPASNTLSWRWVAGMQTMGKTYQTRPANIRKYCDYEEAQDSRLDVQVKESTPWDAGIRKKPKCENSWESTRVPDFSEPYLLWIHGEDLSFWHHPDCLPANPPQAATAVLDPSLLERFGLSDKRRQYIRTVLEDGVRRIESSLGCQAVLKEGDLNRHLLTTAQEAGCRIVAGILPGVGPLRDQIAHLRQSLHQEGIDLILWRRPWDEQWYPQATRGFFPFWDSFRKHHKN